MPRHSRITKMGVHASRVNAELKIHVMKKTSTDPATENASQLHGTSECTFQIRYILRLLTVRISDEAPPIQNNQKVVLKELVSV